VAKRRLRKSLRGSERAAELITGGGTSTLSVTTFIVSAAFPGHSGQAGALVRRIQWSAYRLWLLMNVRKQNDKQPGYTNLTRLKTFV